MNDDVRRWLGPREGAWRPYDLALSPDGAVVLIEEAEAWPQPDDMVRVGRSRLRLADARTGETLAQHPLGQFKNVDLDPLGQEFTAISDGGRVILFTVNGKAMIWTPREPRP